MNIIPFRPPFDLAKPETLTLDLSNFKSKEMVALIEAFEADVKNNPILGPLPVKTGWNEITPVIAIDLLRRNRPGSNRKVDPATANYYALQMLKGQWKATGQAVLVDNAGHLVDAQHRLYASVISGATFRSYVVTDVEAIPNLFAYIDNSKARSAANALQTAGFNGASAIIVRMFKLAEEIRLGVFDPSGIDKLPRLSPAETLELMARYPNAKDAARAANSDWANLVDYIGKKRREIVACLGMMIADKHSFEVADTFFDEIIEGEDCDKAEPIGALRHVIDKDLKATKPMRKPHLLAAMIKTFNLWHKGEAPTRKWMHNPLTDNFPSLDDGEAEAAE